MTIKSSKGKEMKKKEKGKERENSKENTHTSAVV